MRLFDGVSARQRPNSAVGATRPSRYAKPADWTAFDAASDDGCKTRWLGGV